MATIWGAIDALGERIEAIELHLGIHFLQKKKADPQKEPACQCGEFFCNYCSPPIYPEAK